MKSCPFDEVSQMNPSIPWEILAAHLILVSMLNCISLWPISSCLDMEYLLLGLQKPMSNLPVTCSNKWSLPACSVAKQRSNSHKRITKTGWNVAKRTVYYPAKLPSLTAPPPKKKPSNLQVGFVPGSPSLVVCCSQADVWEQFSLQSDAFAGLSP